MADLSKDILSKTFPNNMSEYCNSYIKSMMRDSPLKKVDFLKNVN